MPIIELRASRQLIAKGGGVEAASSFCAGLRPDVIEGFGIPDNGDYETRITGVGEADSATISCDLTKGLNEYPDFKGREALLPTPQQIEKVGGAIQRRATDSSFGIQEIWVTVWPDTTFLLQEEDIVEEPIITEELRRLQEKIRETVTEAKVRLVVSPEQIIGVSSSKEGEPQRVIELLKTETVEVSNIIAEALGLSAEKMRKPSVEVALAADTPFSLEFDSKTKDGESVPETVRRYVAEKALYALYSRFNTRREQAEVWIRQNQPESAVFTSKR